MLARSAAAPHILAFGDSLVEGYGLKRQEAFPAELERLLAERWPGVAVQAAGMSGDTTADALRRLPRVLSGLRAKPDLAIVVLGANDLLQGVPRERTKANFDAILGEFARCGIPVLLAAIQAPTFLGPVARHYSGIYGELAARHGLPMVDFFPEGVLCHPDLTLWDRIHPNARAIGLIAGAMAPAVVAAVEAARPGLAA